MRDLIDTLRVQLNCWRDDLPEEPLVLLVVVLALLVCTGALHSKPAIAVRAELQALSERMQGAIHLEMHSSITGSSVCAGMGHTHTSRL